MLSVKEIKISTYSPLWSYTLERIKDNIKQSTDKDGNFDREKFIKLTVNRVRHMTNIVKLKYSTAVLEHLSEGDLEDVRGYRYAAQIYEGKITMEKLVSKKR